MTFAFYEMSGGDNFVPRSELRQAAAEAAGGQKPVQIASKPATVAPRPARQTTPSRSEAMAAIDTPTKRPPVELISAAAPASLYRRDTLDRPEVTLVSLEQNPALFAQTVDSTREAEAEETITVSPSLAAAVASPISAAPNPTAAPAREALTLQRDIRAVAGTRVNLRGGPGTSYAVMGQLTQNAKVEILADPGTGWVKLRPLAGGPTGWMADYLLTSG